MTTVAEMIRRIRRNISDTDKVGYDDEELLQWINEANSYIRKIVLQYKPNLLYVRETGTGELTPSQMPMKIHSVHVNGYAVKYRATLPTDAHIGAPYEYYRIGSEVRLYPTPTDNDEWMMIYVPPQPTYTLDGVIDWETDFAPIMVEFATIRAQYRNEFMMNQEEQLLNTLTQQLITLLVGMDNKEMITEGYWK